MKTHHDTIQAQYKLIEPYCATFCQRILVFFDKIFFSPTQMSTRIIFGPIRCRISLDEIERQNDDRRLIKNIWFREMLNAQI